MSTKKVFRLVLITSLFEDSRILNIAQTFPSPDEEKQPREGDRIALRGYNSAPGIIGIDVRLNGPSPISFTTKWLEAVQPMKS